MTEKELLKTIGIKETGEFDTTNCYFVDIPDYDTFGKYYSKLEHSDIVMELPSTSLINIHATDVTYQTTEEFNKENNVSYLIKILGDLDADEFKLVVCKPWW